MKTQKEQIQSLLLSKGSITMYEAIYTLGITQLATRITEIERDGIRLEHKSKFGVAKNGRKFRYTEYVLSPEEREKARSAWQAK